MNPVDLRELHAVVKQGLSNDVQDTQPLWRNTEEHGGTGNNPVRCKLDIINVNPHLTVDGYRGEDQTLGPGVGHLYLLQCSHYRLHFGRVASLKYTWGV